MRARHDGRLVRKRLLGLVGISLILAACSGSAASSAPAASQAAPTTAASAAAPTASPSAPEKTLEIAYLSFAVANSYDAPMLASAQAAAASGNAKLTVFDANLDPAAQTKQLQDATASGKFDAIITQPLYGAGLVADVDGCHQCRDRGRQHRPDPRSGQHDRRVADPRADGQRGLRPERRSGRKIGELVVTACTEKAANPCNVGYIWSVKAAALDATLKQAFDQATASHPEIKVVAEGESFYTTALGLKASQDMLQAHPDLTLIVGADQAITGAVQAVGPDNKGKIALDRLRRRRDRAPGHQERGALRHGHADAGDRGPSRHRAADQGHPDGHRRRPAWIRWRPLPEGGVVTKANVDTFLPLAEWPG